MIENDRQYHLTKSHAEQFESALAELSQQPLAKSTVHPRLHQAEIDSIRSLLAELKAQLAEYETRQAGAAAIRVRTLNHFETSAR